MKRLILLSFVLCLSIFLVGCSYRVSFIIENLSHSNIVIKYEAKNPNWNNLTPFVTNANNSNKNIQWQELPQDKYKLDKEKGIVEVTVEPNQAFQLTYADPFWIDNEPYGDHFNIKTLSIAGENGSIELKGNQVFEMFQSENLGWSLLPNFPNYYLRYKEFIKKE